MFAGLKTFTVPVSDLLGEDLLMPRLLHHHRQLDNDLVVPVVSCVFEKSIVDWWLHLPCFYAGGLIKSLMWHLGSTRTFNRETWRLVETLETGFSAGSIA